MSAINKHITNQSLEENPISTIDYFVENITDNHTIPACSLEEISLIKKEEIPSVNKSLFCLVQNVRYWNNTEELSTRYHNFSHTIEENKFFKKKDTCSKYDT